jgi:hypothetical protein
MWSSTWINSSVKCTASLSPTFPHFFCSLQEYKPACQSLVFVFHSPVHVTTLKGHKYSSARALTNLARHRFLVDTSLTELENSELMAETKYFTSSSDS